MSYDTLGFGCDGVLIFDMRKVDGGDTVEARLILCYESISSIQPSSSSRP